MSKVVLITGATSGMGKLTTLLASNGYVVYAGTRNKDNLESDNKKYKLYLFRCNKKQILSKLVNTIIQKKGKLMF